MQIILYEPQIPQNTGNIARSCAVTGTALKLIPPMAFTIEEKYLRRAGLDYWHLVDLSYLENPDEWFEKNIDDCFFFTSKTDRAYTDLKYTANSILVFGSETKGLPEKWTKRWAHRCVRIPMIDVEEARCLNLATSVGIGLYEALRQSGFKELVPQPVATSPHTS
jgi:tRNA (cytidine/uridine-2'-O-)-methyltransferase